MRMTVDQPGDDQAAGRVDDLVGPRLGVPDRGDPVALDEDIALDDLPFPVLGYDEPALDQYAQITELLGTEGY